MKWNSRIVIDLERRSLNSHIFDLQLVKFKPDHQHRASLLQRMAAKRLALMENSPRSMLFSKVELLTVRMSGRI